MILSSQQIKKEKKKVHERKIFTRKNSSTVYAWLLICRRYPYGPVILLMNTLIILLCVFVRTQYINPSNERLNMRRQQKERKQKEEAERERKKTVQNRSICTCAHFVCFCVVMCEKQKRILSKNCKKSDDGTIFIFFFSFFFFSHPPSYF